MNKKLFSSVLLISLLIIAALIFLPYEIRAQKTLPAGEDSFETAVPLSIGEYQGGTLEDGKDWYYFIDNNINPGQELQIKFFFTGNTNIGAAIYDQGKQNLIKKEFQRQNKTNVVHWLNGSSKQKKCYLRLFNQAIRSATFQNISLKVIDRFDANSQTDAGGSFENAILIENGEYKGFLDFNYKTSDGEDFYKISVPQGQKLTVKVIPPKNLSISLKIYDKNRSKLVDEYSKNKGAIVTGSIQALTTDAFYFVISPKYSSEQDKTSQYALEISGIAPNTKKSGVANTETETGKKSLLNNPLPQTASSFLSGIGKSIKFILLIVATVLIIIVVTVILLLGKSSKKGQPKEMPIKTKKFKETKKEEKEMAKPKFVYCSKCGAKNPIDAKFCSKCGNQLN